MTEPHEIEAGLRGSAPVLPPTLKSRTLTNCAAEKRKRQHRFNRQITWAVVGVLGMQLLTLSQLDAQNARLIAGNNPPRAFAPISVAEVMESWQERSRQLALLMASSKIS